MMREPVIRRLVFHFGRRGLGPFRRKMEQNDASLGSLVLCFNGRWVRFRFVPWVKSDNICLICRRMRLAGVTPAGSRALPEAGEGWLDGDSGV